MSFSPRRIATAATETLLNRTAFGYTIAAGLIFGTLLGYLSSAQQVFQDQYAVGDKFPLYFGVLALALGAASVVNARIVGFLGMRHVCQRALLLLVTASGVFSLAAYTQDGTPPLWLFMAFLLVSFFSLGFLFGNFNALAMEPLGHIAGTAAAVIGCVSTLLSVLFGGAIGRALDETVLPLAYGFTGLALASLAVMVWTERTAGQIELQTADR